MTNMIISSVGEDLAQLELIYTVRTVNGRTTSGKIWGFLTKFNLRLHMTQQFYF